MKLSCNLQIFNNSNWGVWCLFSIHMWGLGLFLIGMGFMNMSLGEWYVIDFILSLSSFNLTLSGVVDFHSLVFSGGVLVISGSVYYYSLSYMGAEKYFFRFMSLVSFFILSMLVLIFSGNVAQLILGWDGLGLSSYLLVCYYNNSNSSNAGGLTLMINRLGDVGLFIMIFLIVHSSHRLCDYSSVSWLYSLLIILVCSTKSAQLPFSAWLPAAMAAPTPVSSLVHSSTLVTAGIYLMIRFYTSLELGGGWLLSLGVFTAISACLVAMVERDMKKIVALSTLSHLGIMVSMIGFGWVQLAFSHLIFHAFFKALLFLVVGYWIHSSWGYQDLLKISQLGMKEMIISSMGGVAILSLCGLPYLTGFFSKDFFLEVCCQFGSSLMGLVLILLGCLGSLLYSVRMFLMTNKCGLLSSLISWGGSGYYYYSMILLYVLSVGFGCFWVNFWSLSDSVLFVFMEMKLFISCLIVLLTILGGVLSLAKLKSKFFSELLYLSSISRKLVNELNFSLMEKAIKFDNNLMSPYYNNYYVFNFSGYLEVLPSMSYFDVMKLMLISVLLGSVWG